MGTTGQEDIEQLKARLKGASVLFVDDEHIARQVYITWCRRHLGLLIDVARDGFEALDMVEKKDYNCIFMDIQMPGLDGIETVRRLRDNKRTETTPVIALTAYAMYGDQERILSSGFSDYLAKPLEVESMIHMLAKWIPANGKSALDVTPTVQPEPDTVVRTIPDTLPGIDMDKARQRSREDILKRLLHVFLEGSQNTFANIRSALSQGDHEHARHWAHNYVGSAATIQATDLYAASRKLYAAIKANDSERINESLVLTEALHQEMLAGLEGLDLNTDAAAPASPKGVIDPPALVKAMAEAAEHMDQCCTEAEAALEKVRQELKGHAAEALGKVSKALFTFDYRAARLALRELAASLDPPLEV
ncbi:MAG: response regulator [Proteobacteria bacterium]|nr:response regulator [Pseudomonadota bacterium]MBU1594571.1 response regulator [Pseudomonadota bacterium]